MARPKKRPVVDGVELVEHLFEDPKKRKGRFLYIRPDNGRRRILKGTLTPQKANAIAAACTAQIANGDYSPPAVDPKAPPAKGSWGDLVEQYIARKERLEPGAQGKENWKNMRSYLRKFGRTFAHVAPHKIDRPQILEWWDELTHHQQNKRHTELRRLFNWAMGALSSVLYRQAGHDLGLIQELMAHTDEATTLSYQDRGDLPYKEIRFGLTAADIGGKP